MSTQASYSSEQRKSSAAVEVVAKDFLIKDSYGTPNKCVGITPSIYVPKTGPHVEVLVYVEQNSRTKKVTITVTPFDQRRFDQANNLNQRLSEENTQLYLDQIIAAITNFGKALPK